MNQKRNKSIAKRGQDKPREVAVEPEVMPPVQNEPLINARIVQILIEKNDQADIERLMKAELDYNKERLSILREHAEKHPDAQESRKDRGFRRFQYKCLLGLLPLLIVATPFVPLSAAALFVILSVMIVVGVILNGREREIDLPGFVKLLEAIIRKKE